MKLKCESSLWHTADVTQHFSPLSGNGDVLWRFILLGTFFEYHKNVQDTLGEVQTHIHILVKITHLTNVNSNTFHHLSVSFSTWQKGITRILLCEKAHPLRSFQSPMFYYLICAQHKQCSHKKSIDWTVPWHLSIQYGAMEHVVNDTRYSVLAGQSILPGSHANLPKWHGHLFDTYISAGIQNTLKWTHLAKTVDTRKTLIPMEETKNKWNLPGSH